MVSRPVVFLHIKGAIDPFILSSLLLCDLQLCTCDSSSNSLGEASEKTHHPLCQFYGVKRIDLHNSVSNLLTMEHFYNDNFGSGYYTNKVLTDDR